MVTRVGTESDVKDALKHLVELDFDAIEAYETAIEKIDGETDRQKLRSFMEDHVAHTENLAPYLRELGETPPDSADAKSMLTSGKVSLGNLAGDKGVLQAMKSNEEETTTAYSRMTSRDDISPELKRTLLHNFEDEKRHKDWIENRLKSL